ncbi:hypothetical protein DT019_11620 [Streptomyces sp. SDr-06]|uniref:hypothetical protein n=1 Tax=Streptomyces sp. SDr-06 TaxID=2267702 RepID=UPI000DE9CCFB|nr:hypothetical protein [Streptomyces sp. SDr-06]RCH68418.1 hypothetical protein DT019_11620 [Streptomyces sp. SDr-06]
MRLRTALVTAVAAATITALAGVAAADDGGRPPGRHDLAPRKPVVAVPVDPPLQLKLPLCAGRTGSAFPLDTKIHGGPAAYVPGGGSRAWSLDLTNTSGETCDSIHPVLVLVDRDRTLRNSQLTMEFDDPATGRRHPVTFLRTDEDEHIGVFDDGFPGFVIGPGKTLTVPVRLGFADDTVPGQITANAAIVQRRGTNGQWVGESGDYRFEVVAEGDPPHEPAPELAATGRGSALAPLGLTAGALLLAGGALLAVSRRLRTRRG